MPEKVRHFLVSRAGGQVLDIVPAVGQAAVGPVQIADPGGGGDNALQPTNQPGDFSASHGAQPPLRIEPRDQAVRIAAIASSPSSLMASSRSLNFCTFPLAT